MSDSQAILEWFSSNSWVFECLKWFLLILKQFSVILMILKWFLAIFKQFVSDSHWFVGDFIDSQAILKQFSVILIN